MDCNICNIKINNINKRTSIFDHETIICRTCYVAEQLAKTSTDAQTRDVVHFAHIIKDFDLWKSVVLQHTNEAFEFTSVM